MPQRKIQTVEAKHIFLDIVSYTYKRSVEAQLDLIHTLNAIVNNAISEKKLNKEQYLFIPTGDGMCVSMINVNAPFDIHLTFALSILQQLADHNESEKDRMRQFNLRIGINENIDNLITDINGNQNISGYGINVASRIEGLSDNNQILVGHSVYEKLVQREKYMESFVSYTTKVKHDLPLSVHQFINNDLSYINNETPSKFKANTQEYSKLTKFQAYYIANCIKHEPFISKNIGTGQEAYSLIALLHQLTHDEIEKSNITKANPNPTIRVTRPIQSQFEYFQKIDFWVIADFSDYIKENLTYKMDSYFSEEYLFVNNKGKDKLIKDWPQLCAELEIS